MANLVVVCDSCHDKIHGGTISLGPAIQTSDGMEMSVTTITNSSTRISKWSPEDLEIIKGTISKFPKLSMAAISRYLLNQHDIKISSITLKKLSMDHEGVPGGP
jgi:hypothetical protein